MAPVPERPVITVQEAVARKMLRLRAKLGITADDLLPATVVLESERTADEKLSVFSKHQAGAPTDQAAPKTAAGEHSVVRPAAGGSGDHTQCEVETEMVPEIRRWKKEADDMLSLLGTNADNCTHEYPMTELKRKVIFNTAVVRHPHFLVSLPTQCWDCSDHTGRRKYML